MDSIAIMRLYSNILYDDIHSFCLTEQSLRSAIKRIKKVYSPGIFGLASVTNIAADFDHAAYRCAYLHMYAPLHTSLVRDALMRVFDQGRTVFDTILRQWGHIRLCSIGGGPGTDVVAALDALHSSFGIIQLSATVVDCMFNWRFSFDSILRELRSGWYGALGRNAHFPFLKCGYMCANLLQARIPEEVNAEISSADIVSMVKFVSAAACQYTEDMVRNIFGVMKPGAVVLFIDNAAGGFHELIKRSARAYGFFPLLGPLKYTKFSDKAFKMTRFGYRSCFETKVTVHVWQKPWLPEIPRFPSNANVAQPINALGAQGDDQRLSLTLELERSNFERSFESHETMFGNIPINESRIFRNFRESKDEDFRLKSASTSDIPRRVVTMFDHPERFEEPSRGKRKFVLGCFPSLRIKRRRH